jgi:hypothetical protein
MKLLLLFYDNRIDFIYLIFLLFNFFDNHYFISIFYCFIILCKQIKMLLLLSKYDRPERKGYFWSGRRPSDHMMCFIHIAYRSKALNTINPLTLVLCIDRSCGTCKRGLSSRWILRWHACDQIFELDYFKMWFWFATKNEPDSSTLFFPAGHKYTKIN